MFKKKDNKKGSDEKSYHRYDETPTHYGGVSDNYEKRKKDREDKEKKRDDKYYIKSKNDEYEFKRPRDYYRDSRSR